MPDLPTGTVTFLFTDIEGSTRLLKSLGARYAEALEEHQRILRAAFEEAGGREIDTQGDAFFVAFSRAKDAATAALAAQSGLLAHEWPEGARVRVRMGLHTAEPLVGEERYIGLGVHRAARICAAGHGGQVLLSGATQALVEDDLPAGARLLDLGHHRLKDFDRTEHIFQLVGDGLRTDFPALKTLAGQPDEATPFSGREDTLAAAAQAAVETGALGLASDLRCPARPSRYRRRDRGCNCAAGRGGYEQRDRCARLARGRRPSRKPNRLRHKAVRRRPRPDWGGRRRPLDSQSQQQDPGECRPEDA